MVSKERHDNHSYFQASTLQFATAHILICKKFTRSISRPTQLFLFSKNVGNWNFNGINSKHVLQRGLFGKYLYKMLSWKTQKQFEFHEEQPNFKLQNWKKIWIHKNVSRIVTIVQSSAIVGT